MKRGRMVPVLICLAVALIGFSGMAVSAGSTTQAVVPEPVVRGQPPAPAAQGAAPLAAALVEATAGSAQVTYDPGTGVVRFIATDSDHPLFRQDPLAQGAGRRSAEQAARSFLSAYGTLFGLRDQAQQLAATRTQDTPRGRSFVRFQQMIGGVPVLGAELIVQTTDDGDVLSANGATLPDDPGDLAPGVDAQTARQAALAAAAAVHEARPDELTVGDARLYVYNTTILGGPGPRLTRLVWRCEVGPADQSFREFVLVDARSGDVVAHWNQVPTGEQRQVYDNENNPDAGLPGTGPVRVEGQGATGRYEADRVYDFAGNFYNFFLSLHGRDSFDGLGAPLVITTRYCPASSTGQSCPYPNAFFTGAQAVFGQGFGQARDIVIHELVHGVTDRESHLFYYYQSGAINESLSDTWAEFIEQTVSPGSDPTWQIGEDLPSSIGTLRSMSDPPLHAQPDQMNSSLYRCDATLSDNGGVHYNSGVGNKAAYLIAHGGAFNGRSIPGLGIAKAAHIYYEAQVHILTSASNYSDLANALPQACLNLAGYEGITLDDCIQVKNAVAAVAMNQQPVVTPGCAVPGVQLCPAGQVAHDLLADDLENPKSGNWTPNGSFFYPQNPNSYNFDATYASSGRVNAWGADQGSAGRADLTLARDVSLPLGSTPYLRFSHAYMFASTASADNDGGVVEYSIDGGQSWHDAGPLLTFNRYNARLAGGTANPLAGREAFGGQSFGYLSSLADLSSLAGSSLRIRFQVGAAGGNSVLSRPGWFIDDVRLYTCAARPDGYRMSMPAVFQRWPRTPSTPVLNPVVAPANTFPYSVSWSATAGAGVYSLIQSTDPAFNSFAEVFVGSATVWQATGGQGGTYYYRVKARNNWGESGWSNTQSVTVQPSPDAPVLNPINNPAGSASYTVGWGAAARATGYVLQEDTLASFPHPASAYSGPATSWQAGSRAPGDYFYRVKATGRTGESGWSNTQWTTVKPGWQAILSDDFEGSFPGSWTVFANSGAAPYRWNKSGCRHASGGYSVWAAGGDQGETLPCGSTYPDNMTTWMIYGPFATQAAIKAEMSYRYWLSTAQPADRLCQMASLDGVNFVGSCVSGSSSGNWAARTLNLADVDTTGTANYLGQPKVWIAFMFQSDASINQAEGAYVDDVQVRVCPAGALCPVTTMVLAPAPDIQQHPAQHARLP